MIILCSDIYLLILLTKNKIKYINKFIYNNKNKIYLFIYIFI
jgi:hypothetical protein